MNKTKEGTTLTEEEMQEYEDDPYSEENMEKRHNEIDRKLTKLITDYENGKEFKGLSFRIGNNLTIKTDKDSFLGAIDGVLVVKGLDIKGEEGYVDTAIHALKTLKKGAYFVDNKIEVYQPGFFTRLKRAFNYLFRYETTKPTTIFGFGGMR